MKSQVFAWALLATLTVLVLIFGSGCAVKRVMKDCSQINDSHLFLCKDQYEVWGR